MFELEGPTVAVRAVFRELVEGATDEAERDEWRKVVELVDHVGAELGSAPTRAHRVR